MNNIFIFFKFTLHDDFFPINTCGKENYKYDISKADFENANLTQIVSSQSKFINSVFKNTDLTNAVFKESDLTGSVFEGTRLNGANLKGSNFDGVDLSQAIFCETVMPDGKISNKNCKK